MRHSGHWPELSKGVGDISLNVPSGTLKSKFGEPKLKVVIACQGFAFGQIYSPFIEVWLPTDEIASDI